MHLIVDKMCALLDDSIRLQSANAILDRIEDALTDVASAPCCCHDENGLACDSAGCDMTTDPNRRLDVISDILSQR